MQFQPAKFQFIDFIAEVRRVLVQFFALFTVDRDNPAFLRRAVALVAAAFRSAPPCPSSKP